MPTKHLRSFAATRTLFLVNALVVNLQEPIGKTVGNPPREIMSYDRLVQSAEALMPRLPFPKGVYRFRTFEEADAWTEHHILQAARKKSRARRA